MKNCITLLGFAALAAVMLSACVGPAGPQGIQGEKGERGEKGETGETGEAGSEGLSIVWQGERETAPFPAYENWAYYNSVDKKAYIYDGENWQVLVKDGETGPQGEKGEIGEKGETGGKGDSLYLVIFNANGGAFSGGNEIKKVAAEENLPAAAPEEPCSAWGRFMGWYTQPEEGSLFDFTTPITAPVTLYARWLFDKNLLADWLRNQGGGDGEDDPLSLPVNINLDGGWQDLLEAIEAAQKYVELDLSKCDMNGTVFNPGGGLSAAKEKIVSIALPDKAAEIVKGSSIATSAFGGFANLRSFSGANLDSIGAYAFYGCSKLALTELPHGLTKINSYSFQNCKNLALTALPPGVTDIGTYAFSGCSNLALTELPSAVKSILTNAFNNCSKLALTCLPETYTSIGTGTFNGCTSLTKMTLHEKITKIGNNAFSGCAGLTLFTCLAETPPTLGTGVFNKTHADLAIKVPATSLNAYKTAANWSSVADKIQD